MKLRVRIATLSLPPSKPDCAITPRNREAIVPYGRGTDLAQRSAVKCILALVFGAGLTVSFAPSNAWWFAPWCLAGLFILLSGAGKVQAALVGLMFGAGWFGAGFYWIVTGLNKYSAAGPAFSLLLGTTLVLYLSLFPALCSVAITKLTLFRQDILQSGLLRWTTLAALWSMSEWMRGNLFGGMPMLTTGYVHVNGPLGSFAPVMGVYGVSFVNALVAAMFADCLPRVRMQAGQWRAMPLTLIALWLCSVLLDQVDWTRDTGRTLSVRLAQGNLPQFGKYTHAGTREALSTYTNFAIGSNAALTVFPETALPFEWHSLPRSVVSYWKDVARQRKTAILIGAVAATDESANIGSTKTNSVLALLPDSTQGSYDYRYDKIHLVPFAEKVSGSTEWVMRRFGINFEALLPGSRVQPPLILPHGTVAVSICFENLFDVDIAAKARTAQLLLNTSNFAWFDGTYAAAQHLQAGQMRARETGRWFMQASNSGLTAMIDQRGAIQLVLPAEVRGALEGRAHLFDGVTPFMLVGNVPMLTGGAVLLIWLGMPLLKVGGISFRSRFSMKSRRPYHNDSMG